MLTCGLLSCASSYIRSPCSPSEQAVFACMLPKMFLVQIACCVQGIMHVFEQEVRQGVSLAAITLQNNDLICAASKTASVNSQTDLQITFE